MNSLRDKIAQMIAPDSWQRVEEGLQSMGSGGILHSLQVADAILALPQLASVGRDSSSPSDEEVGS